MTLRERVQVKYHCQSKVAQRAWLRKETVSALVQYTADIDIADAHVTYSAAKTG